MHFVAKYGKSITLLEQNCYTLIKCLSINSCKANGNLIQTYQIDHPTYISLLK